MISIHFLIRCGQKRGGCRGGGAGTIVNETFVDDRGGAFVTRIGAYNSKLDITLTHRTSDRTTLASIEEPNATVPPCFR
jgi:hypothetical protein